MSLVNYLRQKSGSWLAIKSILFVLVWTGVYTILILSNAKIVEPGTPALSNARLTISNLHNQLYFLAPLLIVSSLLFFSRPQSIEFFYLVLKKQMRQYLLIYTILETILLISSFLLSFVISAFVTKAPLASQIGLEFLLLLAHYLGVFTLLFFLETAIFLAGKLRAGAAIESLLLLDAFCLDRLGWSVFLNHGLAIVSGQGFFVTAPAVYLAYGLLLYYYLASRAFYQEVKYA
jgi:hypothetical protein